MTSAVRSALAAACLLVVASAAGAKSHDPEGVPVPGPTLDASGKPFKPEGIGTRFGYNQPGGADHGGPGATVPYKSAEEEYLALKAKAKGGVHGTGVPRQGDLPDWSGVWTAYPRWAQFNFDPSLMRDADEYGPLAPDNRAFYEKTMKNAEKGVEWDQLTFCLASGFPRIMAEGFLHEFALTPSVTLIVAETQTEVRHVYTDGRGHLPEDEAYPMWEGDSIGFWDGKGRHARLVIWTTSVRQGVFHRSGPRYSEKLQAVEQLWMDRPDHIQLEMTVYDPVDLTRPWHVSRGFVRDRTPPNRIVDQWVCAENNNAVQTANGSTDFRLPGEPGYQDPTRLATPGGGQP